MTDVNQDRAMGVMAEALQWCWEMLEARDQMNAKVHCAPLRLSPITERVRGALTMYNAYSAQSGGDSQR